MYKTSYKSDGITSTYSFVFPFFSDNDVKVSVDGNVLDTSEYSVLPNPDFTGGTVSLAVSPDSGSQIDIFRCVSLSSRIIDYQPTEKIDPEHLNMDFNFIIAALQDTKAISIDLANYQIVYDKAMDLVNYTKQVIVDKIGGESVLGLYNNLLNVLNDALPKLINDYGSVSEPAPSETQDDYGIL
ncbi:MAG: phage tail fiber protein [Alphaproteobacteria bacterium]